MAYYMYILICVGNHMLSSAILDKSVEVNFSMGNQIACKNDSVFLLVVFISWHGSLVRPLLCCCRRSRGFPARTCFELFKLSSTYNRAFALFFRWVSLYSSNQYT